MRATDMQASLNEEITNEVVLFPSSHTVRYRLLSMCQAEKTAYYIQVILDQEQCTQPLPSDNRQSAIDIFERIKRGTVTPCTLADVLEDMK